MGREQTRSLRAETGLSLQVRLVHMGPNPDSEFLDKFMPLKYVGVSEPVSNLQYYGTSSKIASTGILKSRPILNAKGRLGSNLPFSSALIVWRDTSRAVAKSAWVMP